MSFTAGNHPARRVRIARIWRWRKAVGRVSRSRYENHAASPAVQEMIDNARRRWRETYGNDPAAARIHSEH